MFKRLGILLLLAGSLWAFEDVSFSARTLGMGGDQAAVSDDAFSPIANPALPARWQRPVTSICAVPYSGNFYWTAAYSQPVRGLGTIGGSLVYTHAHGPVDAGSGDADVRFFWAIPIGRYFNLGASIGAHSIWRSGELHFDPFYERFTEGAFLSFGSSVALPRGMTLALSITEINPVSLNFSLSHFGVSWKPELKESKVLSSLLLAGDGGFRFAEQVIKLHLGVETWFFGNHLGLRGGMRWGSDELSGFSPTVGVSLRTRRIERTDFELHYGVVLDYGVADLAMTLHQLSLSVLFGDALREEKDSILAAQAERARRLREEVLERERDRLREELENINKERTALERERADIERLRREALEEVSRIKGLGIVDTDSLINITVTEEALRFDEGSAEIPFPDGYRVLDRIAEFLAKYPGKVLRVEAHTDNVPLAEEFGETYKDNQALSEARAEVTRSYLVDVEGIRASLITAQGLGSKEPVASDETEEGRAQNRRIVILIRK